MSKQPDQDTHDAAKIAIFGSSVLFALVVWFTVTMIMRPPLGCVFGLIVGLLAGAANPFFAAAAVSAAENLHSWSFPDYKPWSAPGRAYAAAAWPITLAFWIVVGSFYKSINRLFPGPRG